MPLRVAQLSDIHCGSPRHDARLLAQAVDQILAMEPDLVVVAGDLTQEGYAEEFQAARDALRPLQESLTTVIVPGNHDAKNVGHLHFEDHFGKGEDGRADTTLRLRRENEPSSVCVVAVDSSKPDLADGEVGKFRYGWIRQQFAEPADLRMFVLHHHLVSVPGTGRERNIVWDAGDVLAVLEECRVDVVLCGHKHVPHVWLLGKMLLVSSGTVSSYRTRGYARPSFNVVEIDSDRIRVTLVHPGSDERVVADFDRAGRRLVRNPQFSEMFSKEGWEW
ncbi:MAG: metallophosphoesterase family protein [Acidimicrobiia bacterium]